MVTEDVCSNGHLSAKSYDLEVSGAFRDKMQYHCDSFPAETSIGDLKLKVVTVFAESYGIVNNILRLADPELLAVVVFDPTGFPLQYCTDDTQTLRGYLREVGYFDSCAATFADPFPIKLRLVPECTWFRFSKVYEKAKKYRDKSQRESWDDYEYRTRQRPDDYQSSDSDSDIELESQDLFGRERPQEKLEENRGVLKVLGRLHVETRLEDGTTKRRRVAQIGGLKCNLKDAVKITTTAKHVLLVFTSFNLRMASLYHNRLDRDIQNDPFDNILVMLLTWDKLSYLLLRKLRKNLDPNVPIIAITESNLHELDLLAFLDTPPSQVDSIYAWGLSGDCVALGLMDVDVDIKWAGLWPSETVNPTYAPNNRPVDISSPEYNSICDFLKCHPRLQKKPKWLEELALFKKRPEYLYLHNIGVKQNKFAAYCRDVFFPNKLANRDWI